MKDCTNECLPWTTLRALQYKLYSIRTGRFIFTSCKFSTDFWVYTLHVTHLNCFNSKIIRSFISLINMDSNVTANTNKPQWVSPIALSPIFTPYLLLGCNPYTVKQGTNSHFKVYFKQVFLVTALTAAFPNTTIFTILEIRCLHYPYLKQFPVFYELT